MSSVTMHKALSDAEEWSDELDERGRWSRRRSLMFMAILSLAFWAGLGYLVLG